MYTGQTTQVLATAAVQLLWDHLSVQSGVWVGRPPFAAGRSLYAVGSVQCLASIEASSHLSETVVMPHICAILCTHANDDLSWPL